MNWLMNWKGGFNKWIWRYLYVDFYVCTLSVSLSIHLSWNTNWSESICLSFHCFLHFVCNSYVFSAHYILGFCELDVVISWDTYSIMGKWTCLFCDTHTQREHDRGALPAADGTLVTAACSYIFPRFLMDISLIALATFCFNNEPISPAFLWLLQRWRESGICFFVFIIPSTVPGMYLVPYIIYPMQVISRG